MSEKGHATGMAGEFHAMELLHRKGHQPALTLGNAKTIDILTRSPSKKRYEISVKAIQGGGKFGIGKEDYNKPEHKNLVFMLFWYKKFNDIGTPPETWIIPATDAENIKGPWLNGASAIYCGNKAALARIEQYKDAWHLLE